MMRNKLNDIISRLQNENYKSFYLAFLRVAISVWLLKEVYFNWASFDVLYSAKSFIVRDDNAILSWLPGAIGFLRTHYVLLIWLYIIVILLNIFGVGRWVTAALLFIMVDVLQKLNIDIVNGGDKMARLILLYLIFASSYDCFVLYKKKIINADRKKMANLLSNLAAYSIMIQLCLVYFSSGYAKFSNHIWRSGEAVYYALLVERFMGTPLNHYIVQNGWLDKAADYLTILFELAFPFLVWIKKSRTPIIIAGIIFHLFIYIFMMLYGFEIVFIMMYGLFFTNEELLTLCSRCKTFLYSFRKNIFSAK
jgi:hypothetical protein